ncbi:MAG TPA: DeoR/GlpR family DNA-binding transcription regulator [Anaerolineae bacterium]|nr:DeoR/GlpR family DNA-binding transcription regulator [Anaerolineae bacterium]HXV98444.1 DeoR/GlpR family DNA-binding transcription regulator [Anaerolineae bacterium]
MTTDRQMKILQHLTQHDSLEVGQLSELLQVSPSTIRRELRVMQKSGLLQRTHGTAQLPIPIHYELPYENRAAHHVEAKRKIAAAAKQMIQRELVIGLVGGTTCTELARQLRAMEDIIVVTNAVNIALELQGQLGKRVIVTGGVLNQDSYELVGHLVTQSLQNMRLDLAFLGVSGVDLEFGFSMSDEPEAVASRAFMAAAAQSIVLADHSKIGKTTFARLCPLTDVDLLITDDEITPEQQLGLEEVGLKVWVAKGY